MVESGPRYITSTAMRERQSVGGISFYLDEVIFPEDQAKWWQQFSSRLKFTFPSMKSTGYEYFCELRCAVRERREDLIPELLQKIEPELIPAYDELPPKEKWGFLAVQLPGDWGPMGTENKGKLKQKLSQLATGRVLEAMCGFQSYFEDSPQITEVAALDFCQEALERYDYPQRTRILYDLEAVCSGETMAFLGDNSFQAVGVCFGVSYLSDPIPVYKEFRRILSPGGKLLVVGGTSSGYGDLIKTWFKPQETKKQLKKCGFTVRIEKLPINIKYQLGDYFLVEGIK